MEILIETTDQRVRDEIELLSSLTVKATRRGLDGGALFTAGVTLTVAIVPQLVSLYRANKEANRHIVYRNKGTEIIGVSEKTLLRLLGK